MEVRCSKCSTEYEFDDALVSSRGTSVKCTSCGHQFRVHPEAGGTAPETWRVRRSEGEELEFRSLRDLQHAIVSGSLLPVDELSHGRQAFRPLHEISELQTFFATARSRGEEGSQSRTLLGGLGQSRSSSASSLPPPRKRSPAHPRQERVTPVAGVPAAANPPAPATANVSLSEVGAIAEPRVAGRAPQGASLPPPPVSAARSSAPPGAPWQNLEGLHSPVDVVNSEPPGRSAGSRWIVALVVLGGLALVAGTVGRDYFVRFIRPEQSEPVLDPRVPDMLAQADRLLGANDFENARVELAKASVLAEREPDVLAALARFELSRAELSALRIAVKDQLAVTRGSAPTSRRPTAKQKAAVAVEAEQKMQLEVEFSNQMKRAQQAVDVAGATESTKLSVVRVQVDALRLAGSLGEARRRVAPLSAQASDPKNAFSLGALDLAEGESGYEAAVTRLRVAARTEAALGKARSLLVFALCQKGDAAGASAELEKLKMISPGHLALADLTKLVEMVQARVEGEEGAAARVMRTRVPAASRRTSVPARRGSVRAAPAGNAASQVELAAGLHRRGDLSGAERAYQSVLQKNPGYVPALVGLGDIARQRRSSAKAAAFYDRVLKQDPSHLQTLMARGDMYWHEGNRVLAVALYRRALARVGTTHALGKRALRRIEEYERQRDATGKLVAPASSPPAEPSSGPSDPGTPPAAASPAPPAAPKLPAPAAPTPSEPPAPPATEKPAPEPGAAAERKPSTSPFPLPMRPNSSAAQP